MFDRKTTFAVMFGNRGFFPASLHAAARKEVSTALAALGHDVLMMPTDATRHGAVETPEEGRTFAAFLRQHRGEYGGVIVCLPNFGDETGAVAACGDCGVPILVQAYPDELDKMAPHLRRDAFCGKFSIMDVFYQYDVPFTALAPHVAHPADEAFATQVDYFDRLCRVVNGLSGSVVGAIGARTTPFKTVRFDELALQRGGITCETFDLADVFARVAAIKPSNKRAAERKRQLKEIASFAGVPAKAVHTLAALGVVLDDIIDEHGLDMLAIRCWLEMQQQLGISPCILLGELNQRGLAAACEVDVCNAVTMRALALASGGPAACLDWNNNYGREMDKCILFHCGPVPPALMAGPGRVADHAILANAAGEGCGYGCNTGRIAPTDFTFGSMMTEDGAMKFYLGQGRFTDDPIPADFFGCAGVAEIPDLQDTLRTIGLAGHRHHTSVARGRVAACVAEALETYLGHEVRRL